MQKQRARKTMRASFVVIINSAQVANIVNLEKRVTMEWALDNVVIFTETVLANVKITFGTVIDWVFSITRVSANVAFIIPCTTVVLVNSLEFLHGRDTSDSVFVKWGPEGMGIDLFGLMNTAANTASSPHLFVVPGDLKRR